MSDLLRHLQSVLADRFRVEREIGRGGMAIVFLAEEHKHRRAVALKVLRPEFIGVIARERFLREIHLSAEFNHPCILPLLDSGIAPEGDGQPALPYFSMPYVEGETLRQRLVRERQLPVEEAVAIARDVAAALDYAHGRGVVHRDIKPENIYLTGGHAVVADFGIARAVQQAVDPDALTSAGLVVGTPMYMSPEQAGGDVKLDGRSDIYALGCVLYEMLGGEPPFTGASAQAVLARHRLDPVPSLLTIRPSLPDPVERAVRRALAKAPADRFGTAEQFSSALEPSSITGAIGAPLPRRTIRRLLIGGAALLAGMLVWRHFLAPTEVLDQNKVVVFPLVERGTGIHDGAGQEVALMIGSSLEHTEPLRWIDGWTWLSPGQRSDIRLLTAHDARDVARRRSARFYIDGAVIGTPDSTRVILRLNDVRGDSLVAQATAAAARDSSTVPQLGLRAVNLVLPRLIEPGRTIDLTSIASRDPEAIAAWLQGERAYRRSRFSEALDYQRKAIRADSALAYAALKGALAAEWEHRYDEAADLVNLALRNDSLLPPKYVKFARALHEYFAGRSDSAEAYITAALAADSTWAEAWTALGEIRYHLSTGNEAGAAEAFSRAREADPEFAPPLFHLAEIAIRSDDTAGASRLIGTFAHTDPDSAWLEQLSLSLACLRQGPARVPWAAAARRHPLEVVQAAKVLSARGAHLPCGEAGFRAVLATDSAPLSPAWGAVLGLQGILTAEARRDQVRRLLDSAVAGGVMAAKGLYVLQAVAGLGLDAEAAQVVAELSGDYRTMGAGRLWFNGIWLAHRGDTAQLAEVASAATRLADSTRDGLDQSTARSLMARQALLRGDTTTAIAQLGQVVPTGNGAQIEWGMQAPFGQERLLLAQLLLARGHPREAIAAATQLDDPRPIIYLMYLRQSLALRAAAAARLGDSTATQGYHDRLSRLGRSQPPS